MSGFEILIPILAVAGMWAAIIILVYMFFSTRHRERMALVERGVDAKIFATNFRLDNSLKMGIVAIMIGIGIFMGYLLQRSGLPDVVAYFTMVLIFGGAGLVGFYFLAKGKENEGGEV
ncbi:MAG: hypothetical protein KDD02_16980 [Phaeodactylibacter sp.]|nr:hypothetical protein [Phaeodactylibacter sp.]MCB9303555.1 hypothetical protein [Lewinellaceae bacterium]